MKLNVFKSLVLAIFSIVVILGAGRVPAAPLVFTIDNAQSETSLSGKIAGFAFSAQGEGSLTTAYSGSINANASGSTIQFTGASTIAGLTNGVWQPAVGGGSGNALADFGAQISTFLGTGYGAARNVVLDLTSPLLTLTGPDFDSSALVFSFATNSSSALDYNAGFLGHSTLPLAGYATNSVANGATLTTNGYVVTLLIQFNTQFIFSLLSPGDTPLDLTGQIVGTYQLPAPPGIISIVLENQNAVLTVENATAQSQLQISRDLKTWSPASTTLSNYLALTIFTTPVSGPALFFRVQQ
jgi:hypothetical protein